MTAPKTESELQEAAQAYLHKELGSRAPECVTLAATFAETPLEGEGPTALLTFDLAPGSDCPAADVDLRHYVAVGQTEPNYFPAYGLPPDEAYSVHVGTRFLLGIGAQGVPAQQEPPQAREHLEQTVREIAPTAELGAATLEALFRVDDQHFAVYRLLLNGDEVYFLGADCPPGFYRQTHLPAPVVLRLHLGQLIRLEADRERYVPERSPQT